MLSKVEVLSKVPEEAANAITGEAVSQVRKFVAKFGEGKTRSAERDEKSARAEQLTGADGAVHVGMPPRRARSLGRPIIPE